METLRIDGYIGQDDGFSVLFGGTQGFSLKSLNEFLSKLPTGTSELKIEINSGGGSVTEGFAIHDRLVSSGMTIHTEVLGLCGSIATVIALSAKPENRSMHENSEYFIHNPYWQPMAPDPLEADDLQRLAEDLKSSEEKILNFYAEKTGQKVNKLQSFMERAKSFTAEEAKKMGFVSQIIGEAVAKQKYLIAAFIDPHKKTTDMEFTASQKTWLEQKFSAFTEKLNKVFTPTFKAMTIDLENGSKIWVESDTEEIVGKSVFLTDESGARTNEAAPDGEYKTADGRTIKVAGGVVTEVMEAAPSETEALKKQVADLTAQLAEATTKAQAAETAQSEQQKVIVAFKQEIADFKNMVLTKDIPAADQDFKGGKVAKSEDQKWLEYKRSKQEAAKAKQEAAKK